MAKDLPYFKFFCSEWNDGDITLESYKIQGLFINVCSYYWSNECELSLIKLQKRFKHNLKEINGLVSSNIIKDVDGYISINFLDEQSQDRKGTSEKNSKAGKKSAEVRKLKALNEKATPVEITLDENPTIKRREEKKREEKRIKGKPLNQAEVFLYFKEKKIMHPADNAAKFFNHYEANGWMRGKTKIVSWKACVKTWDLPKQKITDEDVQKMNPTDRANHLSKILLGGNNG